MSEVIMVGVAGFVAAFVDGSLGMGFGPTSSSILLMSGLSPVSVSATVNIAKVVTGVAGGASHWRFGNVDWRLVRRLALPGAVGAGLGAFVLSNVDGDTLRPILAGLLLAVGVRILLRFRRPLLGDEITASEQGRVTGVGAAGAAGGLTNGLIGAWGPVVTPFLLHRRIAPRIAVGSVNTAEIAVAFVAAGSLVSSSGGVDPAIVLSMLIGGVLAAPVAAWTVGRVPARQLGVLVGGLLLLTNVRELATFAGLDHARWFVYAVVVAAVAWAWTWPRLHGERGSGRPPADVVDDAFLSGAARRPVRRPAPSARRAACRPGDPPT